MGVGSRIKLPETYWGAWDRKNVEGHLFKIEGKHLRSALPRGREGSVCYEKVMGGGVQTSRLNSLWEYSLAPGGEEFCYEMPDLYTRKRKEKRTNQEKRKGLGKH